MDNKYLIFGQARSGTTSLAACFNYGGIRIIQEPTCIQTGEKRLIESEVKKLNFPDSFPEDYSRPAKELIFQQHNPWDLALKDKEVCFEFLNLIYNRFDGIKHIWGNNCLKTNFNIIEYAQNKSIPIIFMYRNNQFDYIKSAHICSSAKISQLTLRGTSKESILKTRRELMSCDIPSIELKGTLKRATKATEAIKILWNRIKKCNSYLLSYEDFYLSEEKEEEFKKICDFINLDFEKLHKDTFNKVILNKEIKQTDEKVSSKIPNIKDFEELALLHPSFSNFILK